MTVSNLAFILFYEYILFSAQSPSGTTDDRPPPSSNTSTLRRHTPSHSADDSQSQDGHTDDIRLCTTSRAHATDSFGIELNYQIREQFHILKIPGGINNAPSSKNFI
jgi:hypothetical protein